MTALGEDGSLLIMKSGDTVRIEQADPRIWVHDEMLADMMCDADVTETGWANDVMELDWSIGGPKVLRFNASNGSVTYRLKQYDHQRSAWFAEWPD